MNMSTFFQGSQYLLIEFYHKNTHWLLQECEESVKVGEIPLLCNHFFERLVYRLMV